MRFYSFLLLVFVLGCRPAPELPTASPAESPALPPPSDQDLVNQLMDHYYTNADTPAKREQNTLIDYALEHQLPCLKTESGIFYYIKTPGHEPKLRPGQHISTHYRGYHLDGTTFDSSYDRGRPISFSIGQMIDGWNEMLPYLGVGGKATLLIPSRLAYGSDGFPPKIGPDTPLAFDVEVTHAQ